MYKRQVYDLADAEATVNAYPGKLVQGYAMEDIDLKLELLFVSDRTALIMSLIHILGDDGLIGHQVSLDRKLGLLTSVQQGLTAVSYTHLDVYKRQGGNRLCQTIIVS